MANPTTAFPAGYDAYTSEISDPSVPLAVNAIESMIGALAPASLTGVFAQSMPDSLASSSLTSTAGTVFLTAQYFTAGQVLTHLNFVTAVTAASTPTNQWAVVASFKSSPLCLAIGTDGLTTAIAADTVISLPIAYTIPTSGLYYVGHCIAGTTGPTIAAAPTLSAHGRGNVAPFTSGPGDTGKTTPYTVGAAVAKPTVAAAEPLYYFN